MNSFPCFFQSNERMSCRFSFLGARKKGTTRSAMEVKKKKTNFNFFYPC